MSLFRKSKIPLVAPMEGYRRWAATYRDESNPIKENSDRLIEQWFPGVAGRDVLDAGCGPGKFCQLAEQRGAAQVTGVDFAPEMISLAKEKCLRTEFLCQDVSADAFTRESYDLVICALVLGHCEGLVQALTNLGSSVRPGGLFLITDFHPTLSQQKAKRTFRDPATGETTEIQHHIHLINDYTLTLSTLGFVIEELVEPKWEGQAVVFGIKARKNPTL